MQPKPPSRDTEIPVTSLTPSQKQQLWLGIKTTNPHLAEQMKSDPTLNAIKDQFQGIFMFKKTELDRYMSAATQQGR